MGTWETIKAEWPVLKGAPISFAGLLIVGLCSGFAFGMMWRGQEVANYESVVKLKDGQLDEYQKATNARLDRVEKILSAKQLSSLEQSLKSSPSNVIISSDPNTSKVYAKQLEDVFTKSGWEVDTKGPKYSPDTFTLETKDALSSDVVKKALNAGDVPFVSKKNDAKGTTEFQLVK